MEKNIKNLKNHHLNNDIAISTLMHTNMGKYSRTVLKRFNDLLCYEQKNISCLSSYSALDVNWSISTVKCYKFGLCKLKKK